MAANNFTAKVAGAAEMFRIDCNERMAHLFGQVDFILCATNPDVAFTAEGPMPTTMGDVTRWPSTASPGPSPTMAS